MAEASVDDPASATVGGCTDCARGLLRIVTRVGGQRELLRGQLAPIQEEVELDQETAEFGSASHADRTEKESQPCEEPLKELPEASIQLQEPIERCALPSSSIATSGAPSFFFVGTPHRKDPEQYCLHSHDTPASKAKDLTGVTEQSPTASTASAAKGSTVSTERSPPLRTPPGTPPVQKALFTEGEDGGQDGAVKLAAAVVSTPPQAEEPKSPMTALRAAIAAGPPLPTRSSTEAGEWALRRSSGSGEHMPPRWAHQGGSLVDAAGAAIGAINRRNSLRKTARAWAGGLERSTVPCGRRASSRPDVSRHTISPVTAQWLREKDLQACPIPSGVSSQGNSQASVTPSVTSTGMASQASMSQTDSESFVSLGALPPGGLQAFLAPAPPPGSPPPMAAIPSPEKKELQAFETPSVPPLQKEAQPLARPPAPVQTLAMPAFPTPRTQPQELEASMGVAPQRGSQAFTTPMGAPPKRESQASFTPVGSAPQRVQAFVTPMCTPAQRESQSFFTPMGPAAKRGGSAFVTPMGQLQTFATPMGSCQREPQDFFTPMGPTPQKPQVSRTPMGGPAVRGSPAFVTPLGLPHQRESETFKTSLSL